MCHFSKELIVNFKKIKVIVRRILLTFSTQKFLALIEINTGKGIMLMAQIFFYN